MHPSAPRSSRSSVPPTPSLSPSPTPSPSITLPLSLTHQQPQQHIFYGPVTTLHPPCIYPASNQPGKSTKWHGKAKAPRSQYCHGQPTQSASAHLSYAGKPLVIYDQTQAATTPASTSSFLVSSSTFSHGQFPADHYNSSGVAHLPPPYFKPPDVQTFCLVQDRQPQPQHNSYYNISATNTCSLQTANSNPGLQLPNLTPYAVAAFPNNQIPAPLPVPSAQIFQTAPLGLVFGPPPREKRAASNLDVSVPSKCVRNKLSGTGSAENHTISKLQNEWPPSPVRAIATSSPTIGTGLALSSRSTIFDSCRSSQSVPPKSSCLSTARKQPEDQFSDESSTSFDFTIEAEKMVSALCNTASSNDLGAPSGKDDNRKTETNYFNGAGDNVANRGSWIADIEMDYPTNGSGACRTVGTQTQPNQGMTQQLPELIRKTTYWGCSEAETILTSPKYQDPKLVWLSNISSATRTAITKSSTCFPVFTDDRTFVNDLINALLRITNGWLILDNYLNKQHYPNVSNKFDAELTRCFQDWEESTYELLRNVIQTFIKLDEASQSNSHGESQSGSFPGDVSLYTQAELLGPPMTSQYRSNNNFLSSISSVQPAQESAYAVHYTPHPSGAQNFHYLNPQQGQKEIKPRSKLTITESSASAIDGTKSVPEVTMPHADPGYSGSKFRAKCSTPSAKTTSPQSLNAEFFDLRNKVMESNTDVGYQWNINSDPRRKAELVFGTKPTGVDSIYSTNSSTGIASLYTTRTANSTYEGPSTKIDPVFHTARSGVESVYFGRSSSGGDSNFLAKLRMDTDYRSQLSRHTNMNYTGKILEKSVDSVYLGKSSTDQLELATVPRNKMTLLSQIELSPTPRKEPDQMAANLTAWFASMRTSNPMLTNSSVGKTENRFSESFRSLYPQESSRSVIDITRQLQMDPNRQLQTIQNMQSIQSAPWNACNLINKRSNVQQIDEYDSSEDVRVYMKPGSYNVPKKRHQRRQNKRTDNSATVKKPNSNAPQNNYPSKENDKGPSGSGTVIRLSFPTVPILQTASFSLENSPRTPRPVNSTASLDFPHDIAWKAACASAEILLEALNVKEGEVGIVQVKDIPGQINGKPKCEEGGASSYEASEDDSGSTCKLSPLGAESKESKIGKTNIKTDSWLIRTLNNASIKQRKEPDLDSSESSNSSVHEDELTAEVSIEKLDVSLRRSQEPRDEDQAGGLAEGISRATYSETVRRCASGTIPKQSCRSRPQKAASNSAAGSSKSTQKSQRKETERSFSVHKSRKSSSKRATKDLDVCQNEESAVKDKLIKEDLTRFPALKGHSKKKDATVGTSGEQGKNKSGDRGWSVWYSSRRRQSLSPMALKKLEMIHQTVWQMEEAEMFKYPPSNSMAVRSPAESIEDYYKVIKHPMFLDTIDYKLKNEIYHKVEHVVRDFRRIVFNSRLYHKNDTERMAQIEVLSKKLDNLFHEHFTNWDFENITGSPQDGNGSPVPTRHKLSGTQKAQRSANTKKNTSVSTNLDNTGSVH